MREPLPGTIGWRLREARREARLSRRAMAMLMGGGKEKAYRGYLWRVETGVREPREYEMILLIVDVLRTAGLEVDPEWLYFGRKSRPIRTQAFYDRFPDEPRE